MLAAFDAHPREDARERQDPRRQAARGESRAPATIGSTPETRPARPARASLVGARSTSVRSWPMIARLGERAFVDARLKRVLERHHQLDALERARARALRASSAATDRRGPAYFATSAAERVGAGRRATRRRAAARHPVADRRALQLARAFGARQLALRPHERARGSSGDRRAARWPARTTASAIDARRRARAPRARVPADPIGAPTTADVAHAGDRVQHPLDVLREDVQPFGRDDHFLLAPADVAAGRRRRSRRCRRCGTSRPRTRARSPRRR